MLFFCIRSRSTEYNMTSPGSCLPRNKGHHFVSMSRHNTTNLCLKGYVMFLLFSFAGYEQYWLCSGKSSNLHIIKRLNMGILNMCLLYQIRKKASTYWDSSLNMFVLIFFHICIGYFFNFRRCQSIQYCYSSIAI